jgi:4-alpha-glucanotransferase
MTDRRAGGILLHPTSLPGPFGIGDLGPAAEAWVDWLADAGCRLWQVLPLGPTGYGDSPYQSLSTFAGNPLLVSPDRMIEDGLLSAADLEPLPSSPSDRVEFSAVIEYKRRLLQLASTRLASRKSNFRQAFDDFCNQHAEWLDEYALFMALKREHHGVAWNRWPVELSSRDPSALRQARARLAEDMQFHRLAQYLFYREWEAIRSRAHSRDIQVIGDVPIFVAHDSADVWTHPELFALDCRGEAEAVAGVPPDYFSPTGQRWGNPVYRWEAMAKDGYAWWIRRMRSVLAMVDVVRLDHFRGFEAYWRIPAEAPTAETGEWVAGPGAGLLQALRQALGGLPLIAEDLGVITPEVEALRDGFKLPGMKVLQFAFDGDPDNPFLPHNFNVGSVVYTGTHDNDTTMGWYESASQEERDFSRRYLAREGTDFAWDLIRSAWSSVADWAITPTQDLLSLGTQARMNYPSRAEGNWSWRLLSEQLTPALAERIREMNVLYGRSAAAIAADAETG